MRTRKKLILVALCATFGIGALWIAVGFRDNGPSYNGRTLNELVRSHSLEYNRDESGRKQAGEAIGHIGTNAIPNLLDWMQYEEPRWLWRLRNAKWNRFAKDPFRSERSERAAVADQAFDALGSATEEAVGRLTLLVNQTKSERIAFRALCALAETGSTNALPPIVAIFTKDRKSVV